MFIEATLLEILRDIQDFPENDKASVEEDIIKHGEYEIALESICGVLFEDKIVISNNLFERIMGIGNKMKMDSIFWDSIKNEGLVRK